MGKVALELSAFAWSQAMTRKARELGAGASETWTSPGGFQGSQKDANEKDPVHGGSPKRVVFLGFPLNTTAKAGSLRKDAAT